MKEEKRMKIAKHDGDDEAWRRRGGVEVEVEGNKWRWRWRRERRERRGGGRASQALQIYRRAWSDHSGWYLRIQ